MQYIGEIGYEKAEHVRHIKTGNIYVVEGASLNCTNAQDGQFMVHYRPEGKPMEVPYARELSEFNQKFERIDD